MVKTYVSSASDCPNLSPNQRLVLKAVPNTSPPTFQAVEGEGIDKTTGPTPGDRPAWWCILVGQKFI